MAELPTVIQIDKVKYINLAKIINYISSRREDVYQLYVTYGESSAADAELRAIEEWIRDLEKDEKKEKADDSDTEETVRNVFNTLTDKQKSVMYMMIG